MIEIIGYKSLSDKQVEEINNLKYMEEKILRHLCDLVGNEFYIDKRWLSIAKTNIEQGFMAAVRSIANPDKIEWPIT